jgi:oligopeptide transport system substrate-binding protein
VKTRWLRLASCAGLLAGALLADGCGRSAGRADFVFVNGAEPETLDPHIVTGQPEIRIAESLFEGLTSRDGAGHIVPGIAERWEISPDGRTYTFHLRDAVWSNGDPLTSADFLASWQRALDPATASGYADFYSYIVNAEAYNAGTLKDFSQVGVTAPDAHTLKVTLNYPTPFFLDICAFSTLAPVHLASLRQWGNDWLKPGKLVSDGPYTLAAWRINDRVVLQKNSRYWNAAHVAFNRIDALSIQSPATAFNLFYSGVVDLTMDKSMVPAFFIDVLRTKPYYHAHTILGTYFYRFNVTRKPFDDPRVRRALALAIDKRRIVERITRAGEEPAGSLTPPGFTGYEAPPGLGYDPAKARALLAEAGYPGGQGFPAASILYSATGAQNAQIATEIQAIWRENLGIEVDLRAQEWKVYLNSLAGLDYAIGQSSWVGDYPDPNTFLDCFVTGRGNNRTGWSSPAYDGLLADARREADPVRRMAILHQAEALLVDEAAPVIPLYYYVGVSLYHDGQLGGFQASPLDEHRLADLYWIARPKGRGTP